MSDDVRRARPSRHPRPSALAPAGRSRDLWRRAGDALARVGLALTALCLGVVLVVVSVSTVWLMTDERLGNLTQSMSIFTVAGADSGLVLAAGFAGGIAVIALCWLAWAHAEVLDGTRATWVLVGVTLVFELVIIWALQTRVTHWGDSWMIDDFVDVAAARGVPAMFTGPYRTIYYDARLYFTCYPFQATFFWLMYGLRLVFGRGCFMALQVLSALANCLAVWALLDLGRGVTRSVRARRVLWVLVASCLPMYWLATFLYGNTLGFGFAMAFLALQARAMRAAWGAVHGGGGAGVRAEGGGTGAGARSASGAADGAAAGAQGDARLRRSRPTGPVAASLGWVAASFVPLVVALCVKATFLLFAIAVVLTWVVLAVRLRSAWALGASVCVIGVANALSGVPFEVLKANSGGYDFGDALTTLNHLELGLRMGRGEFFVSVDGGEATFAPGGWSDHATAVWAASGEDAGVQNATAARLLAADVVGFFEYPSYAGWFFSVKLATEWADPTYQTLYYLSENGAVDGTRPNPADLSTPLGIACTVLTFMLDGYQTIAFAAAFGYVAWTFARWGRAGAAEASRVQADGLPAAAETSCPEAARASGPAAPARPEAANPVALLLAATFFTGFGCYLLWEAKAVYVLPFAIVVLPLSAAGLDACLGWARACIRRAVRR